MPRYRWILSCGGFFNAVTFFDEVGKLNRLVNIDNIDLKNPKVGGDRVALEISTLATTHRFWTKQSEKSARKKKPRPRLKNSTDMVICAKNNCLYNLTSAPDFTGAQEKLETPSQKTKEAVDKLLRAPSAVGKSLQDLSNAAKLNFRTQLQKPNLRRQTQTAKRQLNRSLIRSLQGTFQRWENVTLFDLLH